MMLPVELVSDFVGIVHKLDDAVASRDDPGLFQTYAQLSDTARVGFAPIDANAGGIAFTPQQARRAALGEALERYAAAFVPPGRVRHTTAAELGVAAEVHRYRRFGPASAHGADLDEDTRLDWVPGYDLGRRCATWVPAHLAYLVASPDGWGHAPHTTSTGLASAGDPWTALRAGLLECVERDAFMTTWLTRRPPLGRYRWTWDQLRPGRRARRETWPQRYDLYRLAGAVPGVVGVLGVARGGPGQPPVAVGAAASCDAMTACRKALREAQQTFAWATVLQATGHQVGRASDIDDLDAHVAYYLDPGRLDAFDFLDDAPHVDVPPAVERDAEQDVRDIVAQLHARDISAFAVDVTTPDLRRCGVWVVRALVPQLYPLVIEHGLVLTEHPRIAGATWLNPDPHPFP